MQQEAKISDFEYKRMYKKIEKENSNLKIRCKKLNNENILLKSLRAKQIKLINKVKLYESILKIEDKTEVKNFHEKVKEICNDYFNIDIDVKVRLRTVVIARVIYYNIVRTKTQMPLKDIASTLDTKQDHSTVINALSNHEDWYLYDKKYKRDYDAIINLLQNEQPEQAKEM